MQKSRSGKKNPWVPNVTQRAKTNPVVFVSGHSVICAVISLRSRPLWRDVAILTNTALFVHNDAEHAIYKESIAKLLSRSGKLAHPHASHGHFRNCNWF